MDAIDQDIKWCLDNNACISDPRSLERLGEGKKMYMSCLKCQAANNVPVPRIPPEYKGFPPHTETPFTIKDGKVYAMDCPNCACMKWFNEHIVTKTQEQI